MLLPIYENVTQCVHANESERNAVINRISFL